MVASVRPGRLTPMPRSRSTENACGEVTSCTRWRSTYKTAGASSVAGGRLVELPRVAGEERHGGSGRRAGAADRVEARQLPAARRPVLEEADEQRVEVAVVDLLLLVREPLQLLEYLVDLLRLELV